MNLYTYDLDSSKYTDWRLPENRLEAFRRVAFTRMAEGDLDHWHSGHVISSEMNLTKEQKAVYALVFGQSYRNHWAMIVLQQFPDILNTDARHIKEWHDKIWPKAHFAKDTKWGLRKFPQYIESIRQRVNGSAYDYLEQKSTVGTTKENFYSLNSAIREFYGIGRMTAWLTQQTIYEFFNFDIDHWDLQLYDDTWSQYDSLCYLFNREDISTKRDLGRVRPNPEEVKLMEVNFQKLMEYCNTNSPLHLDVYNMESCLCEFRKTCGSSGRKPKEFTGWTTVELSDEYYKISSKWPEVDWRPYVAGLMTKGRNLSDFSMNPEYFRVMVDYGLNLNTHYYFKDEPNAHMLLDLKKVQSQGIMATYSDWNTKFTESERTILVEKYDPFKYNRIKPKTHSSWADTNLILQNPLLNQNPALL